jgi:hypothetical protein
VSPLIDDGVAVTVMLGVTVCLGVWVGVGVLLTTHFPPQQSDFIFITLKSQRLL